jgi:hypothetical protein
MPSETSSGMPVYSCSQSEGKRSPSESGTGWRISWNSVECTQMSAAHNIGQLRQHAATSIFDPTLLCSLCQRSKEEIMQVHCRFIWYGSIWIYESRKIKPSRNIPKLLQVPGRYESVLGGLSFSPASLRFDASFPGQVPEIELEKSGHVKLQVSRCRFFITLLLQLSSLFAPSISFSSFSISSCKHWSRSVHPGFWVATSQFLEVQSRVVAARSTFEQPLQLNAGRTWQDNWDQLRRSEESFMLRKFVHLVWQSLAFSGYVYGSKCIHIPRMHECWHGCFVGLLYSASSWARSLWMF